MPEKVEIKEENSVLMAPHDRVLWLTNPDQVNQMEDFVVPILKDLHSQNNSKFKGLSVIIRIEGDSKYSIRYLYGILFSVYQKITLFASKIEPYLTANLDLRVYLEHICDINRVTNHLNATSINFVVYEEDYGPNLQSVQKSNVNFIRIKRDSERIFVPESPLLVSIPDEESFDAVALGGTFDHLHSGHKLMLSLAALLSRDRILCGITASEMLSTKNHPEKLDTLDNRMFTVQEFLVEFKAGCERKVEIVTLRDPYGPTIELDDLDALIVSPETLPGGLKSKTQLVKRIVMFIFIQFLFKCS